MAEEPAVEVCIELLYRVFGQPHVKRAVVNRSVKRLDFIAYDLVKDRRLGLTALAFAGLVVVSSLAGIMCGGGFELHSLALAAALGWVGYKNERDARRLPGPPERAGTVVGFRGLLLLPGVEEIATKKEARTHVLVVARAREQPWTFRSLRRVSIFEVKHAELLASLELRLAAPPC